MRTGLILFAHGARDPRWAAPFEAVAARVRELRPAAQVRLAFLELMPPKLSEAAAELVAAGCSHVAVLPLFLGTGSHLRKDLPLLMQQLHEQYPSTHFALHDAVGEHSAMIAAMAGVAAATL